MTRAGDAMYGLVEELFPVARSLTGDGVRHTLARLSEEIPLEVHEVPTGTPVLDWTVPREWNIRDAWIRDPSGEKVVDFQASNLHVVGYSVPVDRTMTLEELRPHLHTLPEKPAWIPYRTSYFEERWGFCLAHDTLTRLEEGRYEVRIDATLEPGSLTYGEAVLEGASPDEVLISAHCCHPSLANDNLAGMAVAVALARALEARERRLTWRFVFAPATLGAITWLARNREAARRIRHGLILACLGDPGPVTYKRSRRGTAVVDRAAELVLGRSGETHRIDDFVPYGYDERQYCSPGFDLPVGRLTRTPNGEYPEYHTSADDLGLVRPEALADSLDTVLAIADVLEGNATYTNRAPHGEPQLGRRGLYEGLKGRNALPGSELAMLWVLNQSDGTRSLLDIAERSGMGFPVIRDAATRLAEADLLSD